MIPQINPEYLASRIGVAVLLTAALLLAYTPPVTNRTNINFNLDWKYRQGDASGAQAANFADASWESVVLPHSTKFVTPDDIVEYLGILWYRKHFTVDNSYQGKKIFIEFEAAMQAADVYINGTLKLHHVMGWTPFTIDITNDVQFNGADNVIAARLDTRNSGDYPPSNNGIDFRLHGGLYRSVNMYVTDKLHVTDPVFAAKVAGGGVFVTYPTAGVSSATVNVKTNVINENAASKSCTVLSEIVDAQGTVVQSATSTLSINAAADATADQTLTISSPHLWHPNTPYLYTLHTTLKDGATPVDHYATRIGIRRIQWSRSGGFVINGARYKATGSNMHQDTYGFANAQPDRAIFYDVKRAKEAGINFLRAPHYPHDPAFYDACDELGVLVENCVSGWQEFNDNTSFRNNSYQECRDLIRRDRNHPSIVVWETSMNETDYPDNWAQPEFALAHAEFPGDQMFTCGWMTSIWDVFIGASQHGIRSSTDPRAIIICEWGDWDYGGNNSTSRQAREDGDNAMLTNCNNIQEGMNNNRACSWFSADGFWHFHDWMGYNTTTSKSGPVDMYRLPKHSYYFFQSQRDPSVAINGVNTGPMVYIANQWTSSSPTTVRVFSNCEQVALHLNGTLVAARSPDAGTNCGNLPHPPFTFSLGTFTSGELKAIGRIGGVDKATHIRRTPGPAAAIRLRTEANDSLIADGSDARLVWIDIVDASGMVVPTATTQVTVSATGQGTIYGPTSLRMKGGQLATWVRAGRTAGAAIVNATAANLTAGTLSIRVAGSPTPVAAMAPIFHAARTLSRETCRTVMTAGAFSSEFAGKAVVIYDVSGKCVARTILRGDRVDMKREYGLTDGMYLVRLNADR